MAEIEELDEVASSGDGLERGYAEGRNEPEEGLVEGLLDDDDDYDSEDDEDYNPEADLNDGEEDDEEIELLDEDVDEQAGPQFIRGLGPLPPRSQDQAGPRHEEIGSENSKPWHGLTRLPEATKTQYFELLKRLKALDKKELTVLVLGKHFTGKSHTVNSLLNEEAAKKQFLNRDATPLVVHTRNANGLTFNFIDAGAPTDLDTFSSTRMEEIVSHVKEKPIDAVLYVDRFDLFRTDGTDQQVIQGITRFLGPSIWNHAIICLTRSANPTNGLSFDEFAQKRSDKLREAIRKYGGNNVASLPEAFVENSDTCEQNSEGERILPNQKPWLPSLMQRIVEVAESTEPYKYNSSQIEKSTNPNKQLRWLVPIIFVAQIAIKKFILDPLLRDDYNTGDKNGPFDPNVVKGRRAIAQLEKEGRVRKGASRKQQPARSRKVPVYDSDSD